jgi:hypothetical protein
MEKKLKNSGKPELSVPARPDKPAHTINLEQVAQISGVYYAKIGSKRVVVCFTARDRAAAATRYNSVTFPPARITAAKALAKTESLPLMFGVQVRVGGKWDSGWLVSAGTFKKHVIADSDFSLSAIARVAYQSAADSLLAVRFTTR